MNIALKEWAVVVRALAEGRQTVLIRKGGIVEHKRGFELRHDRFLLFPTYEHQKAPLIRDEFLPWLEEESLQEPESIALRWVARVTGFRPLSPGERPAGETHIYSPEFFRVREEYRPDLPLFLLSVALEPIHPATVPNRDAYRGCKSWVNLTEEIEMREANLL